jgi:DNA-binding CsgD family transcriptional regulator
MHRLSRADLERTLEFVGEAATFEGPDAFPLGMLAALRDIVPCDFVQYSELDRVALRPIARAEYPHYDGPLPERGYWDVRDEYPTCTYQDKTLDFAAIKLSDFVTRRELERQSIYAHFFRVQSIEHQMVVGLDAPLHHTKVFLFDRDGQRDFVERDRAILNVLRPHLARIYDACRRRERLLREPEESRFAELLTSREREVMELVRGGKTNGEVAAALWISAGTVRRHLENVYAKLGVHTRTAALARLRSD